MVVRPGVHSSRGGYEICFCFLLAPNRGRGGAGIFKEVGMLCLSRRKDEEIVIGKEGEIRIVVIEIRGDKIRLGIEAPKDVPVHRREVYDAIQRNGGVDLKRGSAASGEGKTGEKNNGDGASRSGGGESGSKSGNQPNASPAS
jgi:carbon storage regulator